MDSLQVIEPSAPGTALAVIRSVLPTILAADKDDILGKLAEKVRAFHADPSTHKGREEIRHMAAEIASAGAEMDRLGMGLTEGWRKDTAAVNAERKVLKERFVKLKEDVRAPLTEYENREATRVAAHEARLAAFPSYLLFLAAPTALDIEQRVAELGSISLDGLEEFTARATTAKADTLAKLSAMLTAQRKADADAAELARLRAAEAERAQRERDEAIAAKAREDAEANAAADRARIAKEAADREAAITAQAEADKRAAADAQARAEREKQEAAERARQAEEFLKAEIERNKVAAEKAEADRIAAAEKADADAKRAAEWAEQERIATAKRVRAEIDAKSKADADAAAARAEDKSNRARINSYAAKALVAAGLSLDAAKLAITAIARGDVPAVTINY